MIPLLNSMRHFDVTAEGDITMGGSPPIQQISLSVKLNLSAPDYSSLSEGDIIQVLQNFLFVEGWILAPWNSVTVQGDQNSVFTESKIR